MIKQAMVAVVLGMAWISAAPAAERALCENGHPTRRPPDCSTAPGVTGCISYGGLRARHGFQRDHCVPLGLGGADTPENVWWQPYAEAMRKDRAEHRYIEAFCRGETSLFDARAYFSPSRCVPGGW